MTDDFAALALVRLHAATTVEQAIDAINVAVARGLSWDDAADALAAWRADNQPQRIGARCHCGRPVPTTSLDGIACCEHDQEIA